MTSPVERRFLIDKGTLTLGAAVAAVLTTGSMTYQVGRYLAEQEKNREVALIQSSRLEGSMEEVNKKVDDIAKDVAAMGQLVQILQSDVANLSKDPWNGRDMDRWGERLDELNPEIRVPKPMKNEKH